MCWHEYTYVIHYSYNFHQVSTGTSLGLGSGGEFPVGKRWETMGDYRETINGKKHGFEPLGFFSENDGNPI